MKIFLFGRNANVGEKCLLANFQKELPKEDVIYLGEKVDLSKIVPEEHNIVIIANSLIFNINTTKIIGMIKKDLSKPLIVNKKIKSFGATIYAPNLAIKKILVNKVYLFGGMLYFPKKYYKTTLVEILKNLPVQEIRSYII